MTKQKGEHDKIQWGRVRFSSQIIPATQESSAFIEYQVKIYSTPPHYVAIKIKKEDDEKFPELSLAKIYFEAGQLLDAIMLNSKKSIENNTHSEGN